MGYIRLNSVEGWLVVVIIMLELGMLYMPMPLMIASSFV